MSDVLIRGMELPGKCGHCRFADAFDCGVDGKFIPTHDTRRTDCPLVPVPQHGRLKDYDYVMKQYSEWFRNCENREYEAMFYMLQNELNAAPTIIQASK